MRRALIVIVDLNLRGKLVIVVGAGREGLKKINSLLTQDCKILVFSDKINVQIQKLVKQGKIELKKTKLKNANFLSEYDPILVISTTDNKELNRKIIQMAERMHCYKYTSDDPGISDFTYPSVINIHDTVQVAFSTGGRSPAMAKKIRLKAEKPLKELIDINDIYEIKLQKIARDAAREKIYTVVERKKFLHSILNNKSIKQLLKDKDFPNAKKEVIRILGEWK